MTFVELIGFIIVIFMMIFLFLKNIWEEKYRREHPEEFAEQQRLKDEAMRQFLKSLEVDVEEELAEELPPLREPMPTRELVQQEEPLIERNPFEGRAHFKKHPYGAPIGSAEANLALGRQEGTYALIEKYTPSRGEQLLTSTPSLKNLIVIHEIIGPPGGRQGQYEHF